MQEEIEVHLSDVLTTEEGYYYGSGTFEYKGIRNWKHSEDGVTFDEKGLSQKEVEAIEEQLMGDCFTTYDPENVGESRCIYIDLED